MKEEILFLDIETSRNWLIENYKRIDGIWLTFGNDGKLKTQKPDVALGKFFVSGGLMELNKRPM